MIFYTLMAMLCAKVASIELNCYYQHDIWFKPIGEENSTSCYTNEVQCLTPWEVVTKVNKYAAGNDRVKTFKIADGRNLNFIPSGIDKMFSNLIGITFLRCNIHRVRQTNFKPFLKIRSIGLPYNDLEVLEKGLFEYNTKLEHLNLVFNNFKHIDAKLLDDLHALTFMNINCIDVQLKGNSTKSSFKSLFESKCQNFVALQNHVDHILREDQHQRLAEEIGKRIQATLNPLKQRGRLDKIRMFNFAKLLANFDKLSSEIQDLKKRSTNKGKII